ncbi:MAG: hypothetical protein JSW45_01615 [Thiotrichales bacterium]|nr:MAG: hypothetical protein JSW45_01615 [Thiotrichales bacterium]
MFSNKYTQSAVAAVLISTLAACSSGGGDSAGLGTTDVTSSGAITAFGSVIINGVRYETENSRIVSEDDGTEIAVNPSDDQLKQILGLGEVITVRGTRTDDSNGVANTIRVDDELVGEITVVNPDGSFEVLGQTVSVTPDTIIDNSIIEDARGGANVPADQRLGDLPETLDQLIAANMVVEVNGFPSQNGIEATRIEDVTGQTAPDGGELDDEVKGFVSQLVPGVSFKINDLTVSYSAGVLDDEDFAGRDLADGDFVEVHGAIVPGMSPLTMDATRIELEDDLVDDDFDSGEVEIEGVVQKVIPDAIGTGGTIVINGEDIRVDDVSLFSEGLRIEIKGTMLSDGSILVVRVEDESEDTVRTEDVVVSSVPGANGSFTTRLGITVTPSDRSRLEDDTIEDDDGLTIEQFLSGIDGQRIEARGFPMNSDTVWTRLEIEDTNDAGCRLRGPVESVDEPNSSFDIMGVTIDVSNVSENNFEGSNDQPIGRQAFFDQLINQLSQGVIVQASSDSDATNNGCNNLEMIAREVEFEPADDVLFDDDGNLGDVNDNEITGAVSNVTTSTFDAGGETITVTENTLIDSSIIEAARGVEIANDQPYGTLTESLSELLPTGLNVVVGVDRSSGVVALIIEDI